MAGRGFVHLHVHTEYSMLDGAARIGDLCGECARLGMPALAVTDHGNLFGAHEFWRKATAAGIKPLIGIEAYVAPAGRHHKRPVLWGQANQRGSGEFGEGGDVSGGGAHTHLTMLAAGATGLRNLFRLSSLAWIEGHYKKPRMDADLIARHAQGIIATTGCPSGEVQTRLRLGQRVEAVQAASDYRDMFGSENFFLELMDHGLGIERSVREGLLALGRTLGLRPLATNDSHYVRRQDAATHDALLCVQTNKRISDQDRFRFEGDGYYLKSPAEMRAYWDTEVPGAADNTLLVAQRVGPYDEVFTSVDRTPRVPLAEGETEDGMLRRAAVDGAAARFPAGVPAGYSERLDAELAVIARMGFAGYFLVVADVAQWAKRHGIACRGRGSAAGSLVAYALGITDLDPLIHGLMFERFINPDRVSPPDIDLDVEESRRGEMVRYLVGRWGTENVAQVITFGTIKTRAAIKDAARVLHGTPGFAFAEKITQALPPPVFAVDAPLSGLFDPGDSRYRDTAALRALVESDSQASEVVRVAQGLEGLVRHAGVHACGVVLSSQPLMDVLPLWRHDEGDVVTGWDFPACEDVGLLKIDVLGSRTLGVIEATRAAIETNHRVQVDLPALLLDDSAVYELLACGDTLGVFQLDGAGARALCRRVRPTRFADIPAMLALYRPGPMGAGAHNDYADRKNGRSEPRPIHPELAEPLAEVLGETYGYCVYQEDVMAVARRVAGYSLGRADLLRRAMGKKKKEILTREFTAFREGMAANGYSAAATQALWDVLLPFADYAFVRSHAVSYGLVSYWTAWLKAHYPAEFMAAQLTSISGNKDRSAIYLAECRRMGIKVLPPDINDSSLAFAAVDGQIRFGLGAVRNVGANVGASIITTRQEKGRYTSFADFLDKADLVCCTKRAVESLVKAGAFDSLGHTRCSLAGVHADVIDAVAGAKRQEAVGQPALFGSPPVASLVLDGEEWPRRQLLAHERDMLGLYVSAHPLDGTESILRRYAPRPVAAVLDEAPGQGEPVTLAGLVTAVDRRVNRQGQPWAVVTLEDLDASVEVVFFAKPYSVLSETLVADTAVAVKGRVNWRDDKMSILGSEVVPLDIGDAERTLNPPVFVLRADAGINRAGALALRSTLASHPGDTPVRILVGRRALAVDNYPVTVSSALLSELKAISGITVAT